MPLLYSIMAHRIHQETAPRPRTSCSARPHRPDNLNGYSTREHMFSSSMIARSLAMTLISRRRVIGIGSLVAVNALLAACGPQAAVTPTTAPSQAPTSPSAPVPSAASQATAAPVAATPGAGPPATSIQSGASLAGGGAPSLAARSAFSTVGTFAGSIRAVPRGARTGGRPAICSTATSTSTTRTSSSTRTSRPISRSSRPMRPPTRFRFARA